MSVNRKRLFDWILVIGTVLCFTWIFSAHVTTGEIRREIALVSTPDLNAQLTSGPAPDFEAVLKDGSKIRLSDFRGRVVFLNFWATWCEPCKKEIPDLEKMTAKMKHVPFTVLAISADESWADIDAFRSFAGSPMIVALDPNKMAIGNLYGTEKLPETYVIDRDGMLRMRFINVQPWTDASIHRYLEWLATSD